jgi:UDP-glucose 4-epimerase
MKVLVTGGLGFIGRALAQSLLAAGHKVDVLTRGRDEDPPSRAMAVTGDLRDAHAMVNIIRDGTYAAICHLAALTRGRDSIADPLGYWSVNAGGTLNLLNAISALPDQPPMRFVFASTNIVYGSQCDGALSEALPPHPESPYAASKAAAERLLSDVASTGAINATVLRIFNAAGSAHGRPDLDSARLGRVC